MPSDHYQLTNRLIDLPPKHGITVTITIPGGTITLEMPDLVTDEALAFEAFNFP